LPDLALGLDYFLVQRVKEKLASIRLTPETIKRTWSGVMRGIGVDKLIAAFRWWTAALSVFRSTANTWRNLKT
jgi:hypothetical protein